MVLHKNNEERKENGTKKTLETDWSDNTIIQFI